MFVSLLTILILISSWVANEGKIVCLNFYDPFIYNYDDSDDGKIVVTSKLGVIVKLVQ